MAIIRGFDRDSVARTGGLRKGDDVVKINGRPFSDMLDYLYFDAEESVDVIVVRKGKEKCVSFVKDADAPLGIDFGDALEITPTRCKNKCVFCFVDQLPRNMRDTLYVKDDDYRLSAICGNYVTLTNMAECDFERIIAYKLSPLYVSVHAADDDVRLKMVKNPNTLSLLKNMQRLADAGITIHAQIVLCEGYNDGEVLKDTLATLFGMYPQVASVAVVPVGLTGCREGLTSLSPLTEKCLAETIRIVETFNEGKNWCWCSDEFYIKAGKDLPNYESYGNFPQVENGVGLVADFLYNFDESLKNLQNFGKDGQKIVFITGESFGKTLESCVEKLRQVSRADLEVVQIKNNFFGGAVTVSGLVVGRDIAKQAPKNRDIYVVPHNMLKEFEDVFLDGTTVSGLLKELGGKKIAVAPSNGNFTELAECIND